MLFPKVGEKTQTFVSFFSSTFREDCSFQGVEWFLSLFCFQLQEWWCNCYLSKLPKKNNNGNNKKKQRSWMKLTVPFFLKFRCTILCVPFSQKKGKTRKWHVRKKEISRLNWKKKSAINLGRNPSENEMKIGIFESKN